MHTIGRLIRQVILGATCPRCHNEYDPTLVHSCPDTPPPGPKN